MRMKSPGEEGGFRSAGNREPLKAYDRANVLSALNKAPLKGNVLGPTVPSPPVNLTHGDGTLPNKHLGNIPSLRCPEKLCQLEG